MIALIPARAGSKRIPGKNTRLFCGHPLIAYTICAADISNVFDAIVVCSDDPEARAEGTRWGCHVVHRATVSDDQSDIEWVTEISDAGLLDEADTFAILRPTSPFRSAEHIRAAHARFHGLGQSIDSMRAVRRVSEHPCKMWRVEPDHRDMIPFIALSEDGVPCHSMPTQSLPLYYVQTSSLEMAWTRVIHDTGTISGTRIAPWIVEDANGLSLDTLDDWDRAEWCVAQGRAQLPPVRLARVVAAP